MRNKNLNTLEEAYNSIIIEAIDKAKIPTPKTPVKKTAEDVKSDLDPLIAKINAGNNQGEGQQEQEKNPYLDPESDEYNDLTYDPEDKIVPLHSIQGVLDSNVGNWKYKEVHSMLDDAYWGDKAPLLIFGNPGIGKSTVVRNFAKETAAHSTNNEGEPREYLDWSKSSKKKRMEAVANPSKYFVLIDIRANQLIPEDLSGIPDVSLNDPVEYLRTKKHLWIWFIEQEDTDGILFLDEINQASEDMLNALFEPVLDRAMAGQKISDKVLIVAAGNLGSQFTGNQEIGPSLMSRFTCGWLVLDPDEWLEYAEEQNFDLYILNFVTQDKRKHIGLLEDNLKDGKKLKKGSIKANTKFPDPRSVSKFNDRLKQLKEVRAKYYSDSKYRQEYLKRNKGREFNFMQKIKLAAEGMCGADWAREFMAFLAEIGNVTLPQLIKDSASGQFMKTKDGQSTPYSKAAIGAASFKMANYVKDAFKIIMRDVKFPPSDNQEQSAKYVEYLEKDFFPNLETISPAAYELLSGVMKVIHAFQGEELSIFLSDLKRKLPMNDMSLLLSFLQEGHYDEKGYKYFNEVGRPKMQEIMGYTKPKPPTPEQSK